MARTKKSGRGTAKKELPVGGKPRGKNKKELIEEKEQEQKLEEEKEQAIERQSKKRSRTPSRDADEEEALKTQEVIDGNGNDPHDLVGSPKAKRGRGRPRT